MPKILARDPAWLARPTPGFQLFQQDSSKAQRSPDVRYEGPIRKIAHRGTEVFVAVGNELRWSDLSLLKDAGEDAQRKQRSLYAPGGQQEEGERLYRVLKTPVSRPITLLSISPSGNYIALLTSHTCHVSILPSPSNFRPQETTPAKLKSFQIGPTAHVLEQSPLTSALWHPLAPTGDCLVTTTHDACIRLWELDSENRSSFDEPALALDLKKLANATTTQADFSASKYGTNKGFSPDDVEMQVAAACFGGQGSEDEHGWASMTLWVAMTEGDVYALCPFLPSKWRAPATLLPALSTSVMEKARAVRSDPEATESERRAVDQQTKWLAEVDGQDALLVPGDSEFDTVEVFSRPQSLNTVPKLQGPFQITPEPEFGEITDIHVIAPKIDEEALYDEEHEVEAEEGLGVSVVCLATNTNVVHVCLDVDGVEAEWLPSKRSRAYALDDVDDDKTLVLFETIDLASTEEEDDGFPTFTPSPIDRYDLFVTYPMGVCTLSFKPWITMLEDELQASSEGADFRLNIVLDSAKSLVNRPIEMPAEPDRGINTALALYDSSVGYLLLTAAMNVPFATILDLPSDTNPYAPDLLPSAAGALPAPEPRAPYRPAPEFDQPSALPRLIKAAQDRKLLGSNDLKSQVRFSPATLQLLTEAHRIMSTETHRLGMAAADLFRRCERMRSELQEQVRKVAEIAQRVDSVTGQDEDALANEDAGEDGEDDEQAVVRLAGKEKIEHRIEVCQQRTAELNERVEMLRRKMGRLGGKELSAKEKAFANEVEKMEKSLLPAAEGYGAGTLVSRLGAVQGLKDDLVARAEEHAKGQEQPVLPSQDLGVSTPVGVGGGFRKQKLAQVMELLERETALVEAVMERLTRLKAVGS